MFSRVYLVNIKDLLQGKYRFLVLIYVLIFKVFSHDLFQTRTELYLYLAHGSLLKYFFFFFCVLTRNVLIKHSHKNIHIYIRYTYISRFNNLLWSDNQANDVVVLGCLYYKRERKQ